MARNQRKYNTEYKVQAVKLSNEIGSSKAAVELGIPIDTLYGWIKAVKEGRLDIGCGAHTPQTAMSLAEELNTLRKQVKQQEKGIRRLKEENEFLAEASKGQRMKFIALKTEDGKRKGKIAFCCKMLGVSRQGFYR